MCCQVTEQFSFLPTSVILWFLGAFAKLRTIWTRSLPLVDNCIRWDVILGLFNAGFSTPDCIAPNDGIYIVWACCGTVQSFVLNRGKPRSTCYDMRAVGPPECELQRMAHCTVSSRSTGCEIGSCGLQVSCCWVALYRCSASGWPCVWLSYTSIIPSRIVAFICVVNMALIFSGK